MGFLQVISYLQLHCIHRLVQYENLNYQDLKNSKENSLFVGKLIQALRKKVSHRVWQSAFLRKCISIFTDHFAMTFVLLFLALQPYTSILHLTSSSHPFFHLPFYTILLQKIVQIPYLEASLLRDTLLHQRLHYLPRFCHSCRIHCLDCHLHIGRDGGVGWVCFRTNSIFSLIVSKVRFNRKTYTIGT